MVDDLLPPDFNKPSKKKKKGVPEEGAAPESTGAETPPEETGAPEPTEWDLSGESIIDYIEPEPAAKSKGKGGKAKKGKTGKTEAEKAEAAPVESSAEELPDLGTSEWEAVPSEEPSAPAEEVSAEEPPVEAEEETGAEWGVPEFEAPEFGAPEFEEPQPPSVEPEEEPEWGEAPAEPEAEWGEAPDWTSEEPEVEPSLGSELGQELEAAWAAEDEEAGAGVEGAHEAPPMAEEPSMPQVEEGHEDVFEIPEEKKPGFLGTTQGKAAILGAIVLIVVILVAIPMFLFKGGEEEEAVSTTTTVAGGPEQTTSTLPSGGLGEETTTTSVPIIVVEATKDVFALPNVEFRDPFQEIQGATRSSASLDVRLDPNTTILTLRLITRDAGRNIAIVDYEGQAYSVEENEVIDNSFYEIKTIGADYTKLLYGDDTVFLRVGESDVR